MKSKLLIIYNEQFGILTDLTKWCEHLKEDYDITVICFDKGITKLSMKDISVKYINYTGSRLVRGLRFTFQALKAILLCKGKIMVLYYEHCDVLKHLLFFKKMLLDIRTLSVSKDKDTRKNYDKHLINACKSFDLISVISEGVKQKIGDVGHRVCVLPLGADCISTAPKQYHQLKLIYVGTFDGRDLSKTITAVSLFHKRHPECNMSYDIIGDGKYDKLEDLQKLTTSLELSDVIKFHGRIPNHLLTAFFDKANIGVSFVPITEYYNSQPPTKTFEYALSGLFVIATATDANRDIINSENGILIKDNPEDFCHALELIYEHKLTIDERKIRNSCKYYVWSSIVNDYLRPILNNL